MPLSGINSRHTGADVLCKTLFVECKSNVPSPLIRDWRDTTRRLDALGLARCILLEGGRRRRLALWHSQDGPPRVPRGKGATDAFPHLVPCHDRLIGLWCHAHDDALAERGEGVVTVLCAGRHGRHGFWLVHESSFLGVVSRAWKGKGGE